MNCFFIIVYADLKNFDFSYWVCHPSINFKPTVYEQASLEDIFDVEYAKTELSQYI